MHYAREQLEAFDDIANCDYDINEYYNVDPKKVLQDAYDRTTVDAKEIGLVGSSTALVAILRVSTLKSL
jgi:hypothetical protein